MRWQEIAARFVLPYFLAKGEVAFGCPFQPGHGAQTGGLSRAGMAEQRGHALSGQGQVDIE
ncbi:hypothetical protein SDC9_180010 [bioreactor metagenome]|uniref:Uncharacterized protein n=1 Tax=bioreactor metagenome TaxID=1076179 RepID=A0A645H0F0_9ZZZZ